MTITSDTLAKCLFVLKNIDGTKFKTGHILFPAPGDDSQFLWREQNNPDRTIDYRANQDLLNLYIGDSIMNYPQLCEKYPIAVKEVVGGFRFKRGPFTVPFDKDMIFDIDWSTLEPSQP